MVGGREVYDCSLAFLLQQVEVFKSKDNAYSPKLSPLTTRGFIDKKF
jgi:hypothetical protein